MPHACAIEPAAALPQLAAGAAGLRQRDHNHLAKLLAGCRRSVAGAAEGWVEASVAAKGWQALPAARAEEWASGPVPVARFLHLLHDLQRSLAAGRLPRLHRLAPARVPSWSALPAPGCVDLYFLPNSRCCFSAWLSRKRLVRRNMIVFVDSAPPPDRCPSASVAC